MEEVVTKFIYQPNTVIGILLLISLLASIVKPQLLTSLTIGLMLIRPNERIDLGIPLSQILLPVLLLVIIINASKLLYHMGEKSNKYLVSFLILILAQTLIFHPSDLINNLIWIITGSLLYCAIITFMDDDNGIKYLCYAILISCLLICFEPIYYHYTELPGSELWNMFHLPKSGRLQAWGMWANANETAFIACIAVANILFIAFQYKNKIFYVTAVILIPFFMLVVFLTASRAGLASLLLIFFPSIIFIKKASVKLVIAISIVCVMLVSQPLTPERTDAEGSTQERGDLRYKGKHLFLEYPLMGVGFGRARYELGGTPAHNTYIQAFAETGIIGGMFFVAYLYNIGKRLYSVIKTNNTSYTNTYMMIVIGLYCSIMFYLFFGNQLLSILFFLVMAQITTFVDKDVAFNSHKGITV